MKDNKLINPKNLASARCSLHYSIEKIVTDIVLSLSGKNRIFEISYSFIKSAHALSELSLAGEQIDNELHRIITNCQIEFYKTEYADSRFNQVSELEYAIIKSVLEYIGYSRSGASAHKAKAQGNIRKFARELSEITR